MWQSLQLALRVGVAPVLFQAALISDLRIEREARQLAFLGQGVSNERSFGLNEAILDVPLVWEAAAKLIDSVTISAGTDSKALPAGTTMQAVLLKGASPAAPIPAYCTPRIASERKADSGVLGNIASGALFRGIIRSATDKQYCLLDADDDGIASQSVMINAGTDAMRTPVDMPPARLDRQQRLPISENDRLRIVVAEIPKSGKYVTFRLDIIQQGKPRAFTTFGSTYRLTYLPLRKVSLPQTVTMLDARFIVTSVDPDTKRVVIEWPRDVDQERFVAIPDGLKTVVRYF